LHHTRPPLGIVFSLFEFQISDVLHFSVRYTSVHTSTPKRRTYPCFFYLNTPPAFSVNYWEFRLCN